MTKREQYGPWAVITGASDGIGRAIAHRAAADGINVVLAARREDTLRKLAGEPEQAHGITTRVVAVDLSHTSGPSLLLDAVDGLDIGLAVLAAGFGTNGPLVDSPTADELEMIAVNVAAVTQLSQAFAQRMIQRRRGGLVLFGSLLGWQGVPGSANYAATKAYVQSLAEGLHGELTPHGVDVLCVAPGPVHTGFAARAGMTMTSATTPDIVANATWSALGRRGTVVPGFQAKALTATLKTLPRPLRSMILGRVMESMRA